MRILVIHSQGKLAGGADAVFLNGARLLAERGHKVAWLTTGHCALAESLGHTHYSLPGFNDKKALARAASLAVGFVYSPGARALAARAAEEFRPDIVHVHIIHGALSPSVLLPFRERGIPIVQTLHDYHLICPVNTFLSNGQVCEACRGGRYYQAALKRCRRRSWAGSFAYALGAYLNDGVYHYDRLIARYITPGDYLREKMIAFGYPAGKFTTLHNAYFHALPDLEEGLREGLLYAGRLTVHKGVDVLIRAAADLDTPLVIAGAGPERDRLEALARSLGGKRVRFTGFLSRQALAQLYRSAQICVLPSRWYENGPLFIYEAYAHGTPVACARIGSIPEFIEDGRTGALFQPDNPADLQAVLQRCLGEPGKLRQMGANAREYVRTRFSPLKYAAGLETILIEVQNEFSRS